MKKVGPKKTRKLIICTVGPKMRVERKVKKGRKDDENVVVENDMQVARTTLREGQVGFGEGEYNIHRAGQSRKLNKTQGFWGP